LGGISWSYVGLNNMTYDEIYSEVKNILVQSLNVEEEEIKPEMSLVDDLGAESIDFLDITFRVEREFKIPKLANHELFPTDVFEGKYEDCVQNGKVTALGIALLKESIPYGDFSKWEQEPSQNTISSVFTVRSLVKFVEMQQTIVS
jgi:acyl carrier protein